MLPNIKNFKILQFYTCKHLATFPNLSIIKNLLKKITFGIAIAFCTIFINATSTWAQNTKLETQSLNQFIKINPTNPSLENNYEDEFEDDFEDDDLLGFSEEIEIYDPFEKVNRKIFAFNDAFDRYFFQYIAKGYRKIPKKIRRPISNFVDNVSTPFSTINSLIQGDVNNALSSFSSFLINSTLGIGGLIDISGHKNINYREEDFGQTLGYYGMGGGPYLMLPILGPSDMRDAFGLAIEKTIDPLSFNALEIGNTRHLFPANYLLALATISGVDRREKLLEIIDDIRKNSFDPYATLRSAYIQRRNFEILNNK